MNLSNLAMYKCRQVTASFSICDLAWYMVGLSLFTACIAPKDFPTNKPFVYKTEIKVSGDLSKDQKEDLTVRLNNQLDDSLRVRTVTGLTYIPPFLRQGLSHPPVFDTANLTRSVGFMIDLLNSIGYYAPTIRDTFQVDTIWHNKPGKTQMRTTVKFNVNVGKKLKFDSIGFALSTPSLQTIAFNNKNQSLLKKNDPYSKQIVAAELDRLVDLFRNNGYYRISRDDIYAESDTVVAALIDPTLDPIQQAQFLELLKRKREKPTVNIVIKQRPIEDSDKIRKYYVGKITVFPDLPVIEDTSVVYRNDTLNYPGEITIISRSDRFNDQFLIHNIFLQNGKQYRLDAYNRTLTRFNNQLGAWSQAAIDLNESDSVDSVLDVTIRLYPTLKQTARLNLEGSYNTNDILTGTNLFGTDLSLTFQNKNAFKRSIQTTTAISSGVEFGEDFIQTTQTSLSHTIYFPRLNAPEPFAVKNRLWQLSNTHTVINLSASYTDRRDLFTFRSIDASYGYEWTILNKQKNLSHSFLWRPINIEYGIFSYTHLFDTGYLQKYPTLKEAFRTGLVVGLGFGQVVYTLVQQHGIHTNHFRVSAEESGTLTGLVNAFAQGDLLRFIKGDIDYWHHFDYRNTELALHTYAGAGRAYSNGKGADQLLPFYKAFWGGGPNSMRGWAVRQLGLGTDTSTFGGFDKFGDVQVEGNVEYRFLLGTLFSVKLKSAIYTDFGNIWEWTDILGAGSNFELSKFYNDLAVDVGTGLRMDFDHFLIRFDWAYKVRDPQSKLYPNRWFYDFDLRNGQFQLGIGYPW
ncbi:MAG TPA: BamA/TamA family outer membrane protein [Puia sp.]|nr:BamA/TamA family outer membrane protein [Puia sp.]